MKKIELNGVLIIELPEGSYDVSLNKKGDVLHWNYCKGASENDFHYDLESDYTHLKPVNELTEDECAELVERSPEPSSFTFRYLYKNYLIDKWMYPKAKSSFRTLLMKHSLAPSQCYAVFKK